jgi:hypothetical protein
MSEEQWLTSDNMWTLLDFVERNGASDRKLRLLGVALVQRSRAFTTIPGFRSIVETAEQLADRNKPAESDEVLVSADRLLPVDYYSLTAIRDRREKKNGIEAALLRCIFGNPFRPITINQTWLSSTVQNLADSIYTDRAFDRMLILGDALEDAGCTSQEILDHCRSGGEHVRGCWALDLVLGKD